MLGSLSRIARLAAAGIAIVAVAAVSGAVVAANSNEACRTRVGDAAELREHSAERDEPAAPRAPTRR